MYKKNQKLRNQISEESNNPFFPEVGFKKNVTFTVDVNADRRRRLAEKH